MSNWLDVFGHSGRQGKGKTPKGYSPGSCILGHRVNNHVTVIGSMECYRKNVNAG